MVRANGSDSRLQQHGDVRACDEVGIVIGIEEAERGVRWGMVLPKMKDTGTCGCYRTEMRVATAAEANDFTTDRIFLVRESIEHKTNLG